MKDAEIILKESGITPTPVRILVYRCLLNASSPLSLSDIEICLDTVDKSTISRSLALFRERQLLHAFTDGSGSMKYEVCTSHDHHHEDDMHVHFRCEKCGQTFCLTHLGIPQVTLPEGFVMHEINYIISGICKDCANE